MEIAKIILVSIGCVIGILAMVAIIALLRYLYITMSEEKRERKAKEAKKKRNTVDLTDKGLAVRAAVEIGLLPGINDGWDSAKFYKFCEFWQRYEELLMEQRTLQKTRKN